MIDRDEPDVVFERVHELLRAFDILLGNLESPYSDTSFRAANVPLAIVPRPHNLDAYARAGFTVMSLANNHIGDAGHRAIMETRRRLADQGVSTCGAGRDLADARRPAIVERCGLKVGFLAYASVFPHGYEARTAVPGLAPLRAYNHFYEQPGFFAPGSLPRVGTIPDPRDHQEMENDIEALRSQVDVLVMSFHWGDFLRPFVLTDHERRTARLCIDLGADLIVGHHHHALRGIEWYRGKPIFYGLGHLVFDLRLLWTEELSAYVADMTQDSRGADGESYGVGPRDGWPLLPLHSDTRMTAVGWAEVRDGSITSIGFVPCRLLPDGRVIAAEPSSHEGRGVINYVNQCNKREGLNGRLLAAGAPNFGGHGSVEVMPLN